jgi:hypothetical protein
MPQTQPSYTTVQKDALISSGYFSVGFKITNSTIGRNQMWNRTNWIEIDEGELRWRDEYVIGNNFYHNTIGNYTRKTIFGDTCQKLTIANYLNGTTTNKVIAFGNNLTMCTFQDNCFGALKADLDLSAATHIRVAYNTTIYYDKTLGTRLSYLDNDAIVRVAATA